MNLRMVVLIHLLLFIDKADSKKGELSFVILIEDCLNFLVVFYFLSTIYTESIGPNLSKSACNTL